MVGLHYFVSLVHAATSHVSLILESAFCSVSGEYVMFVSCFVMCLPCVYFLLINLETFNLTVSPNCE